MDPRGQYFVGGLRRPAPDAALRPNLLTTFAWGTDARDPKVTAGIARAESLLAEQPASTQSPRPPATGNADLASDRSHSIVMTLATLQVVAAALLVVRRLTRLQR
jgi:hypothetical protein